MNVQDIYVDENLTPQVTVQGECIMLTDTAVIIQDIRLRLQTPLGGLFYDTEFGSLLHLFKNEDNTPINRQALISEIEKRIDMDSRVVPLSATASLKSWDEKGIIADASFRLIDVNEEQFLHISVGDSMVKVVSDVRAG